MASRNGAPVLPRRLRRLPGSKIESGTSECGFIPRLSGGGGGGTPPSKHVTLNPMVFFHKCLILTLLFGFFFFLHFS